MPEAYGNIFFSILAVGMLAIVAVLLVILALIVKLLIVLNRELNLLSEEPQQIVKTWKRTYMLQPTAKKEERTEEVVSEPEAKIAAQPIEPIEPIELVEPVQAVAVEPVEEAEPTEPIECGRCHKEIRSGFVAVSRKKDREFLVFECEHCGTKVEIES